jgi:hypothetical protein
MPEKPGNLTLTVAILASVVGSLAAGVYAAAGTEPSPVVALFLSFAPLFAIVLWLQGDAARTGVGAVHDLGWFLLMAWPIVIPWYAFRTRGPAGWRLIVGLLGLIVAPYVTALVVGYFMWGAVANASDQSTPKPREAPAALTALAAKARVEGRIA